MVMIEKTGDLFTAEVDAIGHGVNCRGLMGAGIAARFKREWPDMYEEYRNLCEHGLLRPGQIHSCRVEGGGTVINIASQEYPGPDATLRWLELGVAAALEYCAANGLKSLAIPRIGCGIGGLDWYDVRSVLDEVSAPHDLVTLEVWSL